MLMIRKELFEGQITNSSFFAMEKRKMVSGTFVIEM